MEKIWKGVTRKQAWFISLVAFILLVLFVTGTAMSDQDQGQEQNQNLDIDYGAAEARRLVERPEHWITADHSKFEALDKDFTSGPEVTEACLSCHNEAAQQIHQTIHWTWICPADPNEEMGKAGLTYNNF
jgi:hypothetical protein